MRKNSLKNRIKVRIKRRSGSVAMINDFLDLSPDRDQVQRALRQLVEDGALVRVGKGVYVKAKISSLTGRLIPEVGLRDIATEVIEKSGGQVRYTPEQLAYNERRTTQVPNMDFIGINKRISREIAINGRQIKYVMVK